MTGIQLDGRIGNDDIVNFKAVIGGGLATVKMQYNPDNKVMDYYVLPIIISKASSWAVPYDSYELQYPIIKDCSIIGNISECLRIIQDEIDASFSILDKDGNAKIIWDEKTSISINYFEGGFKITNNTTESYIISGSIPMDSEYHTTMFDCMLNDGISKTVLGKAFGVWYLNNKI